MGALKSCTPGDLDPLGHFCHLRFPLLCDVPVWGLPWSASQFGHQISQAGNASLWFLVSHITPTSYGGCDGRDPPQSSVMRLLERGTVTKSGMKGNSPLSYVLG